MFLKNIVFGLIIIVSFLACNENKLNISEDEGKILSIFLKECMIDREIIVFNKVNITFDANRFKEIIEEEIGSKLLAQIFTQKTKIL